MSPSDVNRRTTAAETRPLQREGDDTAASYQAVARAVTSNEALVGRVLRSPQTSLLIAILIFMGIVASKSPVFLTRLNLINIGRNGVFVFIIAVAATFVLVSGGLDLSVGSVFAVGSIASAYLLVHGANVVFAILGGVGLGIAAGLINGVVIVYWKIPPLITTLGMLYVCRGLVNVVTGGNQLAPLPNSFTNLGQGSLWGVPFLIYYGLIVGLIGHIVLEYTPLGYNVRAIGGNRMAARASGIKVDAITISLYVLSGALAAFAGLLMSARLSSGQPSVGDALELQVISAVIIGGTSLFGGIGSIKGTLLGAAMLAILANGLVLMSVNPLWQNVIVGTVLVLAVGLDRLRRTRMWRTDG
jgi:ribose/xylose/arabinose/galactoside ABC-type transport system permease subunit